MINNSTTLRTSTGLTICTTSAISSWRKVAPVSWRPTDQLSADPSLSHAPERETVALPPEAAVIR